MRPLITIVLALIAILAIPAVGQTLPEISMNDTLSWEGSERNWGLLSVWALRNSSGALLDSVALAKIQTKAYDLFGGAPEPETAPVMSTSEVIFQYQPSGRIEITEQKLDSLKSFFPRPKPVILQRKLPIKQIPDLELTIMPTSPLELPPQKKFEEVIPIASIPAPKKIKWGKGHLTIYSSGWAKYHE